MKHRARIVQMPKGAGKERFPDVAKNDSPAPNSYEETKARKYASRNSEKYSFIKDKRVSFTEENAKKCISPGPSRHCPKPEVFKKLCGSPSRKRL